MGGNAVRLGALFGGPVLLCALWGRPVMRKVWAVPLLAVGFAALAFWQWSPAVRDVIKYIEDPAAKSDYFEPLRRSSTRCPTSAASRSRSRAATGRGPRCATTVPLARGWLRQLDTGLHPIFYKGEINRLTYASWLADNAVRYVALPSAKPDKSSYRERALIETGAALPAAALEVERLARVRGAAAGPDRDPARATRTSCSSRCSPTSCCST